MASQKGKKRRYPNFLPLLIASNCVLSVCAGCPSYLKASSNSSSHVVFITLERSTCTMRKSHTNTCRLPEDKDAVRHSLSDQAGHSSSTPYPGKSLRKCQEHNYMRSPTSISQITIPFNQTKGQCFSHKIEHAENEQSVDVKSSQLALTGHRNEIAYWLKVLVILIPVLAILRSIVRRNARLEFTIDENAKKIANLQTQLNKSIDDRRKDVCEHNKNTLDGLKHTLDELNVHVHTNQDRIRDLTTEVKDQRREFHEHEKKASGRKQVPLTTND